MEPPTDDHNTEPFAAESRWPKRKAQAQINTERAAKRLEIAERRRKIAQMLLARTPQREIARILEVSTGTVSTDLAALRREWAKDALLSLENHIAQELAALNADEGMLRNRMILAGDNAKLRLETYDRVLRVMERRSKLMGLDAPIRLELARIEAERMAKEYDLDPQELLELAEEIMLGRSAK